MQWYQIDNEILTETNDRKEDKAVCVCMPEELKTLELAVAPRTILECGTGSFSKLEAYDEYDFFLLNVGGVETNFRMERVGLYLFPQLLVFVCQDSTPLQKLFDSFQKEKSAGLSLIRIVYAFFDSLTANDSEELSLLEDSIAAMEERVIEDANGNYIRGILALRKKLLFYKKYYQQLLDVMESVQENENGLLSGASLRRFKMFAARVQRLSNNVQNLRDYISQVREAYQAQADLRLNKIMKFFTVITTIFLPLSLVAGWYGMNFSNMPELSWQHGYLYAGCLSVLCIIISIWYIRRKNLY